jgi:transcriptional regulator with XRE-family HTH domain
MQEEHRAHSVDLHVGGRIRVRRKLLGISQERLAERLGLTFQQVQKYERGSNRVSASKLYGIACILAVPVSFFFDGLPAPEEGDGLAGGANEAEQMLNRFLLMDDGVAFAEAFLNLDNARVRRQLLNLVRALASDVAAVAEAGVAAVAT